MRVIGIDPGANGAIACLDLEGKVESIRVMPKIASGFDGDEFNKILKSFYADATCKDIEEVYIEDVHALFGSSAKATFTFGRICGIIEGIVIANHLRYTYVQPKVWQKEMFFGVEEVRKPATKKGTKGRVDTKAMSEMACKRLFPDIRFLATDRCTKVHDGMTDACLIAEYGRRRLKHE